MKLSQLPNRFEYHDSVIHDVKYDTENQTVRVELQLLLFMQEWYDEGKMPDSVDIVIKFYGVSDFELEDKFSGEGDVQYISADDETRRVEIGFYYDDARFGFMKLKAEKVEILDYAGYDEV